MRMPFCEIVGNQNIVGGEMKRVRLPLGISDSLKL